ncbi:phosphate ABC transporter ATP-binding protein PstB [Olsenella urininfantis]|uniref:phosphate ABC transporter ATP-binding protein PstB n=1 Tax=Olsenella urininfantis TaxID=1871033 RepID=UPI000986AC5E|nr:phosphate ABC transporter ATP-binding protein PstB [Olsenella urininfantis]
MSDAGNGVVLSARDVSVSYGTHLALQPSSIDFAAGSVTALIGPSGCGKSTFLRCLNLMNREIRGCTIEGRVIYHGQDVNTPDVDSYALRRQVGMVFQQPNPFPKSIYENVAFAPRRHGMASRSELDALVERSLRAAALWDETKDKLFASAMALSGGQQQRLCIARALALDPDVVIMDEPCSALDPIATFSIEDTISDMASRGICVIIVTHNMEQAARVSDRCAFFLLGELVEQGPTNELFSTPKDNRLEDYLTGRFG